MSDEEKKPLCEGCGRPYHGSTEIEYVCDSCSAKHYVDEFYVCCKFDAQQTLISLHT